MVQNQPKKCPNGSGITRFPGLVFNVLLQYSQNIRVMTETETESKTIMKTKTKNKTKTGTAPRGTETHREAPFTKTH